MSLLNIHPDILASRFTKGDEAGCWLWKGSIAHRVNGRYSSKPAHRVVYELYVGPIPTGMLLHHKCEHKLCVNPSHLVPIDRKTHSTEHNTRTHCKRGHALTLDNLRIQKSGKRTCLICDRMRHTK